MTQLALVIDLNVCVGCQACVTSCKEWNTSGAAGSRNAGHGGQPNDLRRWRNGRRYPRGRLVEDTDNRVGGLLFFFDDAGERHIANVSGAIVPVFIGS